MKMAAFLELIDDLFELEKGTLKGSESLDNYPWDSLAIVTYIALVDEHCGIIVDGGELEAAKTIDDLVSLAKLSN